MRHPDLDSGFREDGPTAPCNLFCGVYTVIGYGYYELDNGLIKFLVDLVDDLVKPLVGKSKPK